jgi:hypothetical protein
LRSQKIFDVGSNALSNVTNQTTDVSDQSFGGIISFTNDSGQEVKYTWSILN